MVRAPDFVESDASVSELEAERIRNADLTTRLDRERTLRTAAEESAAALALSAKVGVIDCGEGTDSTACQVCVTCLRSSRDYAVTQRANAEFARVRAEEDAKRWEARVKLLEARASRAVASLQGRDDDDAWPELGTRQELVEAVSKIVEEIDPATTWPMPAHALANFVCASLRILRRAGGGS